MRDHCKCHGGFAPPWTSGSPGGIVMGCGRELPEGESDESVSNLGCNPGELETLDTPETNEKDGADN